MNIKEVANQWVKMWDYDIESEERRKYDWIQDLEFELTWHKPDQLIDLVLEILNLKINNRIKELLAAGPLEQVLADHGPAVIERIENLAKSDKEFASLLGGVWQNAMSNEIWQRVQNVWDRSGWDGNA